MEYIFTLKYLLSAADCDHPDLVERLGAAGCDGALVGIGLPVRLALEFTREADSAEAALVSALADVKQAVPTAELIAADFAAAHGVLDDALIPNAEFDEFQPFRGLPITLEQDAEIRAHITRCEAAGVPWDTLELDYLIKDLLSDDALDDALIPNVETVEAMPEARRGGLPSFSTADEFMAQLRQKEAAELLECIERKGLLTGEELQERLGVGGEAIDAAVKAGQLFAVAGPAGDYYPAFYADPKYDRCALEKVSKALGNLPASVKYHFFTNKSHRLGRVTPLDALADGRLAEALVAAQGFAER